MRRTAPVRLLPLLLLLLLRGTRHTHAKGVKAKGVGQLPRRGALHHLDAPRRPSRHAAPVCRHPQAVQPAAALRVVVVAVLAGKVALLRWRASQVLGLGGRVLVRPGELRRRRQGRRLEAAQGGVLHLAPAQ